MLLNDGGFRLLRWRGRRLSGAWSEGGLHGCDEMSIGGAFFSLPYQLVWLYWQDKRDASCVILPGRRETVHVIYAWNIETFFALPEFSLRRSGSCFLTGRVGAIRRRTVE